MIVMKQFYVAYTNQGGVANKNVKRNATFY